MKNGSEELQKAMYAVSEKLYKNAAPQGQPGDAAQGAPQGGDAAGNVYDAEYKDVDGDKK